MCMKYETVLKYAIALYRCIMPAVYLSLFDVASFIVVLCRDEGGLCWQPFFQRKGVNFVIGFLMADVFTRC